MEIKERGKRVQFGDVKGGGVFEIDGFVFIKAGDSSGYSGPNALDLCDGEKYSFKDSTEVLLKDKAILLVDGE